jgi:serine/threonine-protein kinase
MVLGTPRYMSPEQISGLPVDQRSDIFSLGIVLYEMLTGTRLFAGEDMEQVQHSITQFEHVPPTRLVPALPAMLDFVVARALKKDPAVRYQDAHELAADLSTCLAELRGREISGDGNGEGSKTVKLEASPEKAPEAPAARAIAVDTRLPLSRLFDSSAALQALKDLSKAQRERLGRRPRPVGLLRRISSDAAARHLFFVALFAGIAGAYVALGV